MRRAIAFCAAALFLAAMTGCGGGSDSGSTAESAPAAASPTPSAPPAAAPAAGAESAPPGPMVAAAAGVDTVSMAPPGGDVLPSGDGSSSEGSPAAGAEGSAGGGHELEPPPNMNQDAEGRGRPGQQYGSMPGSQPGYGSAGYGRPGDAYGRPPDGGSGSSSAEGSSAGMAMPGAEGSSSGMAAPGSEGASSGMAGAYGSAENPAAPGMQEIPPGSSASAGMPGYPGSGAPGYPGSGMPGYPGAGPAPPPPPPPGYDVLSQFAFQQGRETDGFKYLYAYALTNDEGASQTLPKIEWVSGLKGPSLGVRWAVGVQVTPDSYKANMWPVGTSQQLPRGGAAGGRGGASGGGTEGIVAGGSGGAEYGAGGGAAGAGLLMPVAGELGERFLTEFQSRVANGVFGQVIQEMPLGNSGAQAPGGAYGGPEMGSERGSSGYPGGPGMSGMPMGGAPRPGVSMAQQITPGLSYLGRDTQERLLQKAAKECIQVLVLLKVEIQVQRKTNLITNETEIVLLDVAKRSDPDPKKCELYRSEKFTNLKVQYARDNNKNDGVQEAFAKLFKYVDENLVVSPTPTALKPEHVQGRISALAAMKHESLLPVLTEIRFWQRKNLLKEEELLQAYKQLIGDEPGTTLATGEEDAKKKIVERWLPKS